MRSEKPYTKLENVTSRFSCQCVEERTRSILEKKLSQKLNSTMRYSVPKVKVTKS